MKTSSKALKTYVQIKSTPINSKTESPLTLVSLQVWPTMTFPSAQVATPKGGTAVAKWATQTLVTIVRCMKLAGNFPDRAVSELYDTAAHLHNRLPHGRTGNEKTSYELLHNKKPNFSCLRAIGCTAYIHQPGKFHPKKHSPRAQKGTLICYNSSQNSKYRILIDNWRDCGD
jgi:hypothetical protein